VAIVGSGPAGYYVAGELLAALDQPVQIDVIDRLPTPWGLLRSGVAPDHQNIKSISKVFEKIGGDERLRFLGNVELGRDIHRQELLDRYDIVVYAVGAQSERRLGIPGEHLPGVHSAREFVGWYNGHPDHVDARFPLSGARAVVVGNGNVAVDVARILSLDHDALSVTDIADPALLALQSGGFDDVLVCGRRGPQHAAFTVPELRELGKLTDVRPVVRASELVSAEGNNATTKTKLELLRGYAALADDLRARTLSLRFLLSPVAVHGTDHVTGVEFAVNELVTDDAGNIAVRASGRHETVACELVLTAVGYRGAEIVGVPFDPVSGTIPNVRGRVTSSMFTREYCAGWIKRGPAGIIGTNKQCACETVASIRADLEAGRIPRGPQADIAPLDELIRERGVELVDDAGWGRIDAHERAAGERHGRPRVKTVERRELLDLASTTTQVPVGRATSIAAGGSSCRTSKARQSSSPERGRVSGARTRSTSWLTAAPSSSTTSTPTAPTTS
jgi:ferredoxin--NADP+ reductase